MDNAPIIRHFHEIILWPLQIIAEFSDLQANHWQAFAALSENHCWEAIPSIFSDNTGTFQEQYYKEFVTFLPYVQRFLYGEQRGVTGYGTSPMRTFRQREVSQIRLISYDDPHPIILAVPQVNLLFFYDIDIIILVVEIVGHDLPLAVAQEILFKFGRTYPAFWEENGHAGQCFQRVEWLDRTGKILACSDYEHRTKYLESVGKYRAPAIARHWEYLLQPLTLHQAAHSSGLRYRQIEYHRMPLMAYLTVDDPCKLTRGDFVRLALVTRPGESAYLPYAESYLADFEKKYCYDRFWDPNAPAGNLKSRYLCCGHAFLLIGPADDQFFINPEIGLLGQFRHQYFLLCLIPHFHKAALHLFSEQLISAISRLDVYQLESFKQFKRDIRKILSEFLRFTHRYWFHEISNQAQAHDLFKMLVTQLGTEELYKNINDEVQEMNQYLESDDLRRQAETVVRLTVVMTLSIIGTITTGFLGMNILDATETNWIVKIVILSAVLIPSGILTLYTVARSKMLAEFLDVLSNEHLTWRAKYRTINQILKLRK